MKKKDVLRRIVKSKVKVPNKGPFAIKFGPTSLSTPPTSVRTTRSGTPSNVNNLHQNDNTHKATLIMTRPVVTNSPAVYGPALEKEKNKIFKPS